MAEIRAITCVSCPKGCEAEAWLKGSSIGIRGKICKLGREYIRQEFIEPLRVLTSTVAVQGGGIRRLPVRSAKAIPRRDLITVAALLSGIRVRPPIAIGQVILRNVAGTGVDILASDDLAG